MAEFVYEALDQQGHTVRGKLEAENELTAAERIKKRGLLVVEVHEQKPSFWRALLSRGRGRVNVGDLALFSRQLAAMLDAGIPLTRALYALGQQRGKPSLQQAVLAIAGAVESGSDFSAALAAHPRIFSSTYASMVRAGEIGGSLVEVLLRLSTQLEQEKALRDQIRAATFYPFTVIGFALLIVLLMLLFVVPSFIRLFPENIQLPLATRLVIALSGSLRRDFPLWLAGLAAALLSVRILLSQPLVRGGWERIKFRLPVVGVLIHHAALARFARLFSTLLAGGIPVLQALETAGPASGSALLSDAAREAGQQVQEGQSIAGPLQESGHFPPLVTQMIAVGEESGSLPDLLARVAGFYEAEVAAMAKGLASLLEPLLLIFVGCMVGAIVISLYLPMFLVVTSVGK
ncbi:MAG: type II secretion system F family protein [Bacillota bacterium]